MTAFWKIEHDEHALARSDAAALAHSLRRHVRHTSLVSMVIRIGLRSQAYVAGNECPGCRQGRCMPGCHAELLRRVLASGGLRMAAQPLHHTLAQRPYRRFTLARPARLPQPLAADLVSTWPEARLQVRWQEHNNRLAAGALLAVGDKGPEPAAVLRAAGWAAFVLPRWLGRMLLNRLVAIPCRLAGELQPGVFAGQWSAPEAITEEAHAAALREDRVPDATYEHEYHALLAAEQPTATRTESAVAPHMPGPLPVSAAHLPWPAGPLDLASERVAVIVEQMLATPAIIEGRPTRVGLAVSRVARATGMTQREARALLVWFDQAGLVEPAPDPSQPWLRPRPLVSCDPLVLSARLHACPPPDEAHVRAVFGGAAPCNP
ncbi:MAG TPA: hypothetical protein VFT99_00920 [Roseiflexaceae bacterium]|nr:hypothetical protein [Roseiflexaceae bacterium]